VLGDLEDYEMVVASRGVTQRARKPQVCGWGGEWRRGTVWRASR